MDRSTVETASRGMNEDHELDPESLGDHVEWMYRAASALCGSPEEAEDLVQESLARVLRRPRTLRSNDDVGYLLRVLKNTYLTQRRTASRRPLTVSLSDVSDLPEEAAAAQPEARIESIALYAAISGLPEHFRGPFVAVDVVGLSYREAARALNVPEATVTTRLHRARHRVVRSISTPLAAAELGAAAETGRESCKSGAA